MSTLFSGGPKTHIPSTPKCFGIPATCYRTENAQIPKSAGESAGKSAGKKGTAGGTAGSSAVPLLFQRNRPPSTAPGSPPSSPLFPGTLPSTLPSTFGDLGVLSPVAGRWDSKKCCNTKKILRGIHFVKLQKIFSSVDPESGHSCLVHVQYLCDSPRSAWELQEKSVPQRIPVKITKKKPGGELICKKIGVNGRLLQHKASGPHPKHPILDGPQKKLMCLISWKARKKGTHINFIGGSFWGQKGGPKQAIFGHKKFSSLFFSCP